MEVAVEQYGFCPDLDQNEDGSIGSLAAVHNQKKIQIANDEKYQEIELFDKPGLFSNGRIARDNLPEGVYCYDLRLSLIHI